MAFPVLKSSDQKFVINGDYSVSSSGVYEAGGAIFEYQRIDGLKPKKNGEKVEGVTEWITCTGPTMEAVHLMVRITRLIICKFEEVSTSLFTLGHF